MNEGKLGHLERASVLAASDDPKDQDKAREIKTRFDYESLKRQIGSKKKPSKPAVKEAAGAGVPLTPQELEIQKKMSRLNVRLAKKRSQQLQKAKLKDTEDSPEKVKDDQMQEGSLHKWFKGSKSKDGKAGWVNVKTGGTCASDEPGEGTPKCVSSSKRASMSKAERDSASRRKKAADPNQQSKTGAAKPTYVSTDKKKMKEETNALEKRAKENEKARKFLKKDAKDSGYTDLALKASMSKGAGVSEACWKGYEKKGMKTMFGKRYPNCVKKTKKESYEINPTAHKAAQKKTKMRNLAIGNENPNEKAAAEKKAGGPKLVGEGAAWTKKSGKSASGGLNEKGRKSYEKENPGSDLKAPSKKVGNKRRASFCARMKGMKKKLTSAKTARDPDSRINKSLRAWNC